MHPHALQRSSTINSLNNDICSLGLKNQPNPSKIFQKNSFSLSVNLQWTCSVQSLGYVCERANESTLSPYSKYICTEGCNFAVCDLCAFRY